jgi:aryl-alcohol dehydrogenase-like predicted oxidoreductase
MQDHYNLINQEEEREMFPLCADEKIGVLPWSPLARGRLTRDPDASTNRQGFDKFGQALYQQMTQRSHPRLLQLPQNEA